MLALVRQVFFELDVVNVEHELGESLPLLPRSVLLAFYVFLCLVGCLLFKIVKLKISANDLYNIS